MLHIDSSLDNKDNIAINIVSMKANLIEAGILNKITKKHWVIQVNELDNIKVLSVSKKKNARK